MLKEAVGLLNFNLFFLKSVLKSQCLDTVFFSVSGSEASTGREE